MAAPDYTYLGGSDVPRDHKSAHALQTIGKAVVRGL